MGRYTFVECRSYVGRQCERISLRQRTVQSHIDGLVFENAMHGDEIKRLAAEFAESLKALTDRLHGHDFG